MNILIADDHPLYREALATVLDGLEPGVRIHQAATFDEVIARVSDPSLAFDLILLDLYMGAGDWNAAIEKVRLCCPRTPVIVISGSASRADSERAMRAGAYGYIPKAMKTEEMLSAIRLIVTGGVCIQPRDTGAEPGRSGGISIACHEDIDSRLSLLTARQRDVLAEIGAGKSNKLIARSLGMTEGTVKLHVAAILKCLGMANRTQAAVVAHQLGSSGAQAGNG
jgi:DNA-binding NarL/FixJ family response regulator